MTRYADPHACPDCRAAIGSDSVRCPACTLPLRGPVAQELFTTLLRADDLLARLRWDAARTPITAAPRVAPAPTGPPDSGSAGTTGTAAPSDPPEAPAYPPYPAPAAPARPRGGLGARTVPMVLLGLGALCLLVAGSVFLWVTWEMLGVGGRTVVVTALTLLSAGATFGLARRGLRTAAESMATVTAGFLLLCVVGLHHSGWLGGIDAGGATTLAGLLLLGAGWGAAEGVRRLAVGRLILAECAAGLGFVLATAGQLASPEHPEAVLTVATVLGLGLGLLARSRHLPVIAGTAAVAALCWWLALLTFGLARNVEHPSLSELWGDLEVWPSIAATLLALLPALLPRLHAMIRVAAAGVAGAVLVLVLVAPLIDEPVTAATAGWLGLLVATTVVLLLTPSRWRRAAVPAQLLSALWPALILLGALGTALAALVPEDSWGLASFDPLVTRAPELSPYLVVPLVATLLGALFVAALRLGTQDARALLRRGLVPALAAVLAAVVATAVLLEVPLMVVVLLIVAVAGGLLARTVATGSEIGLAATGGILALGLLAGLANPWSTAVVLLTIVGLAGWLVYADRRPRTAAAAHAVLPAAVAGLLWTAAEIGSLDPGQRAYPILLLLGVLAIVRPHRLGEASAAVSALIASSIAIDRAADPQLALAIHLTVAGALITISAMINAERRALGWVGGSLLALATWVRLEQIGVTVPEPYTLPSAIALLVVGLLHLRARPESGTFRALSGGLSLALVPSLLWCLEEPLSWRALALGAACLVLVIGGAVLRWSAPLVLGAVVLAVLALRVASPWIGSINPWISFGVAGILLTTLGVTWEARMGDIRRSTAYLRRLR